MISSWGHPHRKLASQFYIMKLQSIRLTPNHSSRLGITVESFDFQLYLHSGPIIGGVRESLNEHTTGIVFILIPIQKIQKSVLTIVFIQEFPWSVCINLIVPCRFSIIFFQIYDNNSVPCVALKKLDELIHINIKGVFTDLFLKSL